MKKFKVWANSMEHYVAYVDAPNEDEAYKIAKEMDGGEFDPAYHDFHGDWEIGDIEEVTEND